MKLNLERNMQGHHGRLCQKGFPLLSDIRTPQHWSHVTHEPLAVGPAGASMRPLIQNDVSAHGPEMDKLARA